MSLYTESGHKKRSLSGGDRSLGFEFFSPSRDKLKIKLTIKALKAFVEARNTTFIAGLTYFTGIKRM